MINSIILLVFGIFSTMNPNSQPFYYTRNYYGFDYQPWNAPRENPIYQSQNGGAVFYNQPNYNRNDNQEQNVPVQPIRVPQLPRDPEYQEDNSVRNLYKVFPKNRNLKDVSPEMARFLVNPSETYTRWAIVVAPHWKVARSMDAVQNLVNFENPENLVADKIAENVKITVQTILKVEEKHPVKYEFSFNDPTSGYCNPFVMDPKSHSGKYTDNEGNRWSPDIGEIDFSNIIYDEHGRRMIDERVYICV